MCNLINIHTYIHTYIRTYYIHTYIHGAGDPMAYVGFINRRRRGTREESRK